MTTKRRHPTYTLKEKLDVLKRLDNGESGTKLAKEYNVGRATISDWKKNRWKIERFSTTTTSQMLHKRHTAKISKFDKVDEALYLWFLQERENGTPLNGPAIRDKAMQLYACMQGDKTFVASNGWLDRWKKRHGIRQFTMSADHRASDEYKSELATLISSLCYSPEEVYYYDAADLIFKSLPSRAVLLTSRNANVTNMPTEPADVRALKYIKSHCLPVYMNAQQACVNGDMFREWLREQFIPAVKMYTEEVGLATRALLVIDNAAPPSTGSMLSFGEIKAVFLPPNVTPSLQPLDRPDEHCLKDDNETEWPTTGCDHGHMEDSPQDFGQVVVKREEEEEDEGECAEDIHEPFVSHEVAARALEVAIRYVEHHVDATPSDLLFLERWRSKAAASCYSSNN